MADLTSTLFDLGKKDLAFHHSLILIYQEGQVANRPIEKEAIARSLLQKYENKR